MLFVFAIAISSCSKEDSATKPTEQNQSQGLIKVTGEDANAATKTALNGVVTSWVATTDKVGIYSPQASATSGGNAGVTNGVFTAITSTASSAFTGAMYWKGTGVHNFYAYYPYSALAGTNSAAVPVTLVASQTQIGTTSTHIGALDFMVATPTTGSGANNALSSGINFKYNHLFTILDFSLKMASGTATLTKLELFSMDNNLSLTSGTVNLTSAPPAENVPYTIADAQGTKQVSLTTSLSLNTTTATHAYMMILPGNQSTTQSVTIKLTNSEGKVTSITKTGADFKRGNKYTVSGIDAITFADPVSDTDGNTYKTVTIGTQVWMAENLKTTKYNDGTAIPNVTDVNAWAALTTGAYCWYLSQGYNKDTYGGLYNWYAVNPTTNGGKNLCPVGWHVPTDNEWTTLTTFLGGASSGAAGKMKETGTSHWLSPNTGATNSSGFSGLPGGYRVKNGYTQISLEGYWWSSTQFNTDNAWHRSMIWNDGNVQQTSSALLRGLSIRCLKN